MKGEPAMKNLLFRRLSLVMAVLLIIVSMPGKSYASDLDENTSDTEVVEETIEDESEELVEEESLDDEEEGVLQEEEEEQDDVEFFDKEKDLKPEPKENKIIATAVSNAADTPTLIFDEIDVGISGITAQKVGAMMHKLAGSRQILSITHLPQIAAKGDHNYRIEKHADLISTHTTVVPLSEEELTEEIARLLSASEITDAARLAAKELLKK